MRDFPITAIRSVALGVPDTAYAEAFYTKVGGLAVAGRQDGIVYLRATGVDHHVLALHPHTGSNILSVDFRVHEKMTSTIFHEASAAPMGSDCSISAQSRAG
jgi:catechol-2,3-dioxygenase